MEGENRAQQSAPSVAVAYDLLDVEVEKPVKKPQQIERFLCSNFPWGEIAPLFFLGTTDNALHCYLPASAGDATTRLTFFRWHGTYKKIFHPSAQFLDSWGVYVTVVDTKATLFLLPLHMNQQLEGNSRVGSMYGSHARDQVVMLEDTKQTQLLAAHEKAKVLCCLSKANILKIFDWTINRTLELRTQHDLTTIFASSPGNILSSSSFPVVKMIVIGESHLFLQMKKDWCVMNIDSGKIVPVRNKNAATVNLDIIACALSIPRRGTSGTSNHQIDDLFIAGKHVAVVVALDTDGDEEEVEPTQADIQIFEDIDTQSKVHNLSDERVRVKVERVMEYNVTPRAVYFHHPYLLLEQPDGVAVYSIGSMGLVQNLAIKSIYDACATISVGSTSETVSRSLLDTGRQSQPVSFFAVSAPFSVQLLKMKPISEQVKLFKELDRLEDAVALCELCPDECNLNGYEQHSLYAEYGFELFRKGNYRKAISLLLKGQIDVMDVLALFPRNLLPRSSSSLIQKPVTPKQKMSGSKKASSLEGEELVQGLLALIFFLRSKRNSILQRNTSHVISTQSSLKPNDEKELELIDTVLIKCLVLIAERDEYHRQADKRLLDIVSRKNWCDIGEAEIFLRSHRRFKALLAFYSTRKLHRKALELLEDLERNAAAAGKTTISEAAESSKGDLLSSHEYMVLMTQYLRQLDQKKSELVFEFSRRVIDINPSLGLSIFTQREVPAGKQDIDPAMILNHLKTCQVQDAMTSSDSGEAGKKLSPATKGEPELSSEIGTTLPLTDSRYLAIEYLTQIIYSGKLPLAPRLHDEVVYLLLDAIQIEVQGSRTHPQQQSGTRLTSRASSQRGLVGLLRRKLLQFLEFGDAIYHPERMLSRTPIEMVDERAALLSKLGRHHEVLQLYALELKNTSLAEAYCNRCYESKLAGSSIYSALLRLYLRPLPASSGTSPPALTWQRSGGLHLNTLSTGSPTPFSSSEAVSVAVNILNKYAERIDVPTALELLPPDVPAGSLTIFFRRVLERQVERYRNGQVKKQLSKMENFKVREMLSIKRKGSVTVWSSHCCQSCGKKLGTGSFYRLPSGALLHFSCLPIK